MIVEIIMAFSCTAFWLRIFHCTPCWTIMVWWCFCFSFIWFHCLSVLLLASCGLLMLMVFICLFIFFYCTLNFSFATRQPLLSSFADKYSLNLDEGILAWFYLRKLSCWRGRGEGVGYHGAKYIQVIVVLACARATVVSWCSCWGVCDRKVNKLVIQVESKKNNTEFRMSHWLFPNVRLPAFPWQLMRNLKYKS